MDGLRSIGGTDRTGDHLWSNGTLNYTVSSTYDWKPGTSLLSPAVGSGTEMDFHQANPNGDWMMHV